MRQVSLWRLAIHSVVQDAFRFGAVVELKLCSPFFAVQVGEYERIISQLSMQLGRPPPVGLGTR